MAVETDGSRFAAGAWETLKRGISSLGVRIRRALGALARPVAARGAVVAVGLRALARRIHLYDLLTSGPLVRFVTKTLQRRIIFANTIGLAILLGGIFYLSQYHAWLIDAKRESLRAQGEIIAAAIAANASIETGRIVLDPDRLPEIEGARSPFRDDGFAALQLSIPPERVTPILRRLVPAADTRARVYGRDGTLIIDTAQLLSRGQAIRPEPDTSGVQHVKLRNTWTRFLSWLMRGDLPVYREIGGANGTAYPEVRMALSGSTTPMLLVNEKGEQIVSMAVPIQYRKAVQGVLLLSTRPGEIDEVLAEERNVILLLALTAFAATLLASLLLARTIAGPMRRLSEVAENVSRNIKARHELPGLSHRADEVGQMATAFREMTASLYRRIEASERFAQDVAHELKNPLTAAALDRPGAGLRQEPGAAAGAGGADPGGAEAAQQAHHRCLQRLAARCRAGAAGNRAGGPAPGAAGRGRGLPLQAGRRSAPHRARHRRGAAQPFRFRGAGARRAPRPRHNQPARQCPLLLARPRAPSRSAPAASGRRSRSSSTTTGRAFPWTSSRRSSTASIPTGPRPTARSARTRGWA